MTDIYLKETNVNMRGMYFTMMCFGWRNKKPSMYAKYRELYRKEAKLA